MDLGVQGLRSHDSDKPGEVHGAKSARGLGFRVSDFQASRLEGLVQELGSWFFVAWVVTWCSRGLQS